jgi:hypothetical protein
VNQLPSLTFRVHTHIHSLTHRYTHPLSCTLTHAHISITSRYPTSWTAEYVHGHHRKLSHCIYKRIGRKWYSIECPTPLRKRCACSECKPSPSFPSVCAAWAQLPRSRTTTGALARGTHTSRTTSFAGRPTVTYWSWFACASTFAW